MILLLGGTGDTAMLAQRFAELGLRVLVSAATNEALSVGDHPGIRQRCGRLDRSGLKELIYRDGIAAVVDATHPYATEIRGNARAVATAIGVPYSTYIRPTVIEENEDMVRFAASHHQAAREAFSFGRNVLLTTGSNHLAPYVAESGRTGLPLFVRVLSRKESLNECVRAGVPRERTIAGRGPFSIEQNRQHIRECNAGVLVTKDGGDRSGVRAKLEAARLETCFVMVIQRPEPSEGNVFDNPDALVRHVVSLFTNIDRSS